MPKQVATREETIEHLIEVFRAHGYDGASLSRIQAATGLKSSSLYNYFPGGKDDMAEAALARMADIVQRDVLAALQGPGTPAERAAAFAKALDRFYERGRNACLLNLMGTGDAQARFAPQVQAITRLLVSTLAALAREAGAEPAEATERAEDVLIALEGALVLGRALEDYDVFARALQSIPKRLVG